MLSAANKPVMLCVANSVLNILCHYADCHYADCLGALKDMETHKNYVFLIAPFL